MDNITIYDYEYEKDCEDYSNDYFEDDCKYDDHIEYNLKNEKIKETIKNREFLANRCYFMFKFLIIIIFISFMFKAVVDSNKIQAVENNPSIIVEESTNTIPNTTSNKEYIVNNNYNIMSDNGIYPVIGATLFIIFLFNLKKISFHFITLFNTFKTKKIINNFNNIDNEEMIKFINIAELQISINDKILSLNNNIINLHSYNEILISRNNSIINIIKEHHKNV